jgi:heptosyltransferase-3
MRSVQRMLCVRRGGLGDTLLVLPILRAMRARAPAARLEFAGVTEFGHLFVEFGLCAAAGSSETLATWSLAAPGDPRGSAARLAQFDWVVGDDPALAAVRERGVAVDVFDPRLAAAPREPAAAQLLARAGLQGSAEVVLVAERAPPLDSAPIVVHVGSGGLHKCWPEDALRELLASLRARAPVRVLAGPAEVERGRAWLGAAEPWHVPSTVSELAAQLRIARAFVGHDTGPTHLAAALRVPTVALFVATDPAIWAPVGPHVRVVADVRVDAVLAALGASC